MEVIPVHFNQEHKAMLGHCKMILEKHQLAIHPKFDKLMIFYAMMAHHNMMIMGTCLSSEQNQQHLSEILK